MEAYSFLYGAERLPLEDGLELRLLSAREILEARREAGELAQGERERSLCSNACLLARALEKTGMPVFHSGAEVLRGMTARQVALLAKRWAEFDREADPSPGDGEERCQVLKKAWSTRRVSACAGACSKLLERFRQRRGSGT